MSNLLDTGRGLKIIFLILFVHTFLTATFIDSSKAHASDITVGATTWYAWGEQYYTQKDYIGNYNFVKKTDPSLLYGPVLAVKFNEDFNLTFAFLYGKFNATEEKDNIKSEFKRSDSDLALNYKLSDSFKVFVGAKYLSYGVVPIKNNFFGGMTFKIKDMDQHTSYGSGLGLSASIPITGNIFGLATVSGLYLWGDEKVEITDIGGANPKSLKIGYNEYGINSSASIAYYIADWSTVISLGARVQYIMADYKDNEIYLQSVKFLIYGITLTATYTFGI